MSDSMSCERPLRILTIDNGGLQVLSVLVILRAVCQAVSKSDEWKAPCELFDVIAGVGAGGWLALLLGRYRLTLQQCASVYIRIAKAITPGCYKSQGEKQPRNPTAISQQLLLEEIAKLIEDRKLSEFLLDEDDPLSQGQIERPCHSFAVGVTKMNEYRLFRCYAPPKAIDSKDPDPRQCRVADACAATAAAKDFMQEYDLGGEVFWDENFPRTHNITKMALEEAAVIFDGENRPLSIVLNISPGAPNTRQVKQLRKAARSNATTAFRIKDRIHRFWDFASSGSHKRYRSADFPRGNTGEEVTTDSRSRRSSDPPRPDAPKKRTNTMESASSVSSQVIEQERQFGEEIASQLIELYSTSSMYQRIAYTPKSEQFENLRPYLNDVVRPDQAESMTQEFLDSGATKKQIESLKRSWSESHKLCGTQCRDEHPRKNTVDDTHSMTRSFQPIVASMVESR